MMDLIENFGSYDEAKQELVRLLLLLHPNQKHTESILSAIDEIKLAMLRYRREHNIFEENDTVVIPSRGNGLFAVSRLLCRSDRNEMRHATDEEIKLGRRLEVCGG